MKTEEELLAFANETSVVLSLLYDLDLMPEQVEIGSPRRLVMFNVISHCRALRVGGLKSAAELCKSKDSTFDDWLIEEQIAKLEGGP